MFNENSDQVLYNNTIGPARNGPVERSRIVEKNPKQKVVFCVGLTELFDDVLGIPRHSYNVESGAGMDALLQVIEEHVPTAPDPEVSTTKTVVYTHHYQSARGLTVAMDALVGVQCCRCCGKISDEERREVEGLYRVCITPDYADEYTETVDKLTATRIHEAYCSRIGVIP